MNQVTQETREALRQRMIRTNAKQHAHRTDDHYKERLKAKSIVTASGCWEWQGFKVHNGYGETTYHSQKARVHRLAYQLWKGPIPAGMDVCHTCDNRPCCNPDHLWVGTRHQNLLDCLEKGRHYRAELTHCERGHAFDEANTYYVTNGRACRICYRGRQRIRKHGWPPELAFLAPPWMSKEKARETFGAGEPATVRKYTPPSPLNGRGE